MKAGWKTTEFWLGLFFVVFSYLNQQLGLGFDEFSVKSTMSVILGYIASRTFLKMRKAGKQI